MFVPVGCDTTALGEYICSVAAGGRLVLGPGAVPGHIAVDYNYYNYYYNYYNYYNNVMAFATMDRPPKSIVA